jgi:hypothetical protein
MKSRSLNLGILSQTSEVSDVRSIIPIFVWPMPNVCNYANNFVGILSKKSWVMGQCCHWRKISAKDDQKIGEIIHKYLRDLELLFV